MLYKSRSEFLMLHKLFINTLAAVPVKKGKCIFYPVKIFFLWFAVVFHIVYKTIDCAFKVICHVTEAVTLIVEISCRI